MALTGLPVFAEVKTIRLPKDPEEIVVDKADKKKLEASNEALSDSNR